MRKIKRHLGKNIGKGTAKIAGLALASVIAAGSAFGVTGVSAMAADDAGSMDEESLNNYNISVIYKNHEGNIMSETDSNITADIKNYATHMYLDNSLYYEGDLIHISIVDKENDSRDKSYSFNILKASDMTDVTNDVGAEEISFSPGGNVYGYDFKMPSFDVVLIITDINEEEPVEPGEEQAGEIQPGAEEPIEIQPDIVEEPVLNLIQTEGGTVTAEPFGSVLDANGNDTHEKWCSISAAADPGWYFKEWNLNYNTDKGMVESDADDFNWRRRVSISFEPSINYIKDTGEHIITYGTANVSAVFERLKEGEYAIYDYSDIGDQKIIFAKAGEKVVYQPNEKMDVSIGESFSLTPVDGEGEFVEYEYEYDENSNTISFIMPENNVDLAKNWVKFSAGVSNTEGEESEDGKNETIVVEEDDSGSKTTLPGSETKNIAVSTTAAPVKAGAPAAVYSAPVRNAGSSTTAAQTGDKTNAPLWIAAAAGSVVAALGAFVIRRKKNSEE